MRIDLPQCDLKNCRYHFDGNCRDKREYERCNYASLRGFAMDGNINDFIKYARETYGYDVTLTKSDAPDTFKSVFGGSFIDNAACDNCSTNPKNGGNGICCCMLGQPKIH